MALMYGQHMHSPGGSHKGPSQQLWGRNDPRARLYSSPPHSPPEVAPQLVTCLKSWEHSLSL